VDDLTSPPSVGHWPVEHWPTEHWPVEHWVVSDVHGHLDALRGGLQTAGLLDADDRWAGGSAELWVLGDLFDRGPDGVGVLDLVIRLQREAAAAGGVVELLLGNHEVLALGMRWYGAEPVPAAPDRCFAASWKRNGGLGSDQDRLTDAHVAWLLARPSVARIGDWLAVHSDTLRYLDWGDDISQVNAGVLADLATRDLDKVWRTWARLVTRHSFLGPRGQAAADRLLGRLGGTRIVHGHSTIPDLVAAGLAVSGPGAASYAGGRVLAVDGGRHDGGELLVVRLEDLPAR